MKTERDLPYETVWSGNITSLAENHFSVLTTFNFALTAWVSKILKGTISLICRTITGVMPDESLRITGLKQGLHKTWPLIGQF